ncbi:hypothetical protein MGYG_05490 [Nannizzia gypsea CBS 118893]|uniref:Uncharacterized protein n=1 Tax=Arthroderma gypseum (strain ATCC MYA-4604 / CBS 118893) TaxID=535722 RepID=E4UW49_ARTGP|nr:hypothetical protein MGYG_05490 [Nannizzia gypsea CBS 118893]EFR02497.1 hypothetical protein MGYG_05490 [Nannizzia gypsea CBS 118893]
MLRQRHSITGKEVDGLTISEGYRNAFLCFWPYSFCCFLRLTGLLSETWDFKLPKNSRQLREKKRGKANAARKPGPDWIYVSTTVNFKGLAASASH